MTYDPDTELSVLIDNRYIVRAGPVSASSADELELSDFSDDLEDGLEALAARVLEEHFRANNSCSSDQDCDETCILAAIMYNGAVTGGSGLNVQFDLLPGEPGEDDPTGIYEETQGNFKAHVMVSKITFSCKDENDDSVSFEVDGYCFCEDESLL